MSKFRYACLACIVLFIGGVAIACFNPKRPLASDYVRTPSHSIAANQPTTLKQAIAPEMLAHPGESGFALLIRGEDALSARLALIQAAERSLDIQYYLIEDDVTGKLLLEAILRAADRGVRVRILVDDLNLHGSDNTWTLLNAHPNIELRIFNPFATRSESLFTRISDVFTGLGQFSKRMHNKIMIADEQAAITGGRNLGDAYFDADETFNFHDVDVIAVGPIVADMFQSFDAYWNADESFPIAAVFKPDNDPQALAALRKKLQLHWQKETAKGMVLSAAPFASALKDGEIPLSWARAELAADTPAKIDLPPGAAASKPASSLNAMAADAQHEFLIISPYFVPGDDGTQGLVALVRRGIDVKVLTNSLASTDVVATFAGYQPYRKTLLAGGVDLYEMQPIPGTHPHSRHFSSSSRDSLHSKIYITDRRTLLIGSFNLDPRSISLNTEVGLVIHSPALAQQLALRFEKAIAPSSSFHVILRDNHLEWIGMKNGQMEYYPHEPEAGFWCTIEADLFALLPLESQL